MLRDMLNPNNRMLYTSALTPPVGMVFDQAVATTFSMDPTLLLEAPVYLALLNGNDREKPDPLQILQSIRRYADKITVYVQAGRIQVPESAKANPVYSLLEKMIVEAKAPNGGSFHPKVWAIRFIDELEKNVVIRLVVLTRNLTNDQSWDLSLVLDGRVTENPQPLNEPLKVFFEALPSMATRAEHQKNNDVLKTLVKDVVHTKWELPENFKELEFYIPGHEKFNWRPPRSTRLAVISPFCSDPVLNDLIDSTEQAVALISREEELDTLLPDTIDKFDKCLHLDEAAETIDGGDQEQVSGISVTGLHAKAFIFETGPAGRKTNLVVGSANATNAALKRYSNVELLVRLSGPTRKVGGIDQLLDDDGFGKYLTDYTSGEITETDSERKLAEEQLELARNELALQELTLHCEKTSENNEWQLTLVGDISSTQSLSAACVWPITVSAEHSVSLITTGSVRDDGKSGIVLGNFALASITGLLAFSLKTTHEEVSASFVLNLPVEGLPAERDSAVLNSIISKHEDFLRYLIMLLSIDSQTALADNSLASGGSWLKQLVAGDELALLEILSRAYCRDPERLDDIARLVEEISISQSEKNPIPEKFNQLWGVYSQAMERRSGGGYN